MEPLSFSFVISAFVAGVFTFLAPCTLPLVPGYLSFISGSSVADLQSAQKARKARWNIFVNGLFYVIGFSLVFIFFFGVLFGVAASAAGPYRVVLAQVGGVLVLFFGLFLVAQAVSALSSGRINLLRAPLFSIFNTEHRVSFRYLKPGNPLSSLLLGASFAFGWTPCVGPILSLVLALTVTAGTLGQSILLLAVFSLGLAIPFLATALAVGWAAAYFGKMARHLYWVSLVGGIFLVALGLMMVTGDFTILNSLVFGFLKSVGLGGYEESLLDFL